MEQRRDARAAGNAAAVTLARLLDRAALRDPEAPALVEGARRLTYADLARQAAVVGRGLAELGVAKGDRVLIALKNRLEHALVYWALQRIAGALAHVIQCGYQWGERTLGVMPLYHTMGIHSLTSMAAVNGRFVCQADWSAREALALIESERVTALYLIPTLYHDLVHAAEFPTGKVSSVRKLAYAGAPMLAALAESCANAFRPDVFVNHYGSTEIYTFSVCPAAHTRPGCAGRPGVHSKLRVVEASVERRVGPDETVPAGEKGEIIASLDSDEAFAGYWKRPDADAKALRDGWYFTGDMGYLDEAGDLFVAGRVDDMIISGGENIHPVEVEEVVARHPRVRDVAVVGEPDDKWGERVVAFVVPSDARLTAHALDRYCLDSPALANFKRPRRIVFVEAIPRTASGKILRRLLRDGHYVEVSR